MYGRGDFLLVVKELFDDIKIEKKKKFCFKNKPKDRKVFIRYTDYFNSKPFYILEIERDYLNSERIQKLLSAYKGRIVLNEKIPRELFEGYLFNATEYFLRALLSSLANKIRFEKNIQSICIKYSKVLICEEIFELVKIVRNFHYEVEYDDKTEMFKNECFARYGTFVSVGWYNTVGFFDIYIDLSQMSDDIKCEIYFKGKRGLLYPDYSYFEVDDNVRKLLKYGVDKKIGCAICEVKKA